MSEHINSLRHLLSFCWHLLSDDIQAAIEVVGEYLDFTDPGEPSLFDALLAEVLPSTCTILGSLPSFERFYMVTPDDGDTLSDRRERVIAKIRSTGDLNKSYFYQIAAALGYSAGSGEKYITIVDGSFQPFRAGYSRAGIDAVYSSGSGTSMYTVRVIGTGVETDSDLQYRFNQQKLLGIEFIFQDV